MSGRRGSIRTALGTVYKWRCATSRVHDASRALLIRMTRLRTVLACGSLLLLSSLSLSVLFISLLGREEAPVGVDLSRRYVQDSRLEPRNRNILDVHYTGEVEREERKCARS